MSLFLFTTVSVFRVVSTVLRTNGFYSVYHRFCFPSSVYSLSAPTVFILFIAVSVFRVAHRATALHSYKAVENSFS